MKRTLRALLHTAIGGFAAGLATIPAGMPLTARTILFPAIASALTSLLSHLYTANGPATK
jgi:hypothetical protein